ncbi:MAG: DNA repair protein RecO [Fusobacteriaceae bacterium]|nr:DNA repair protein RecO [Fusobacteriaceae bacterium]MBP6322781.1 DNA repair protein RecO [Fusobacteriaceae bacterium]MBP9510045.1 DNA repair protein RecO [Fusobacteriaceae bacterium]
MNRLECQGIVIYKEDYSEADARIVVFTDSVGIMNLYIKGIRKTKKRDIAAVDILSYSKFSLIRKNDMYNLSDFELINDFTEIKKDLEKLSLVFYVLDVVKKIFLEEEPRKAEFNLLKNVLNYIETENKKENQLLVIAFFLFKIIKSEGIYFSDFKEFFIGKKESDFIKETAILKKIMKNEVKKIEVEKLEEKTIFNLILLLEDYINRQLEVSLNLRKILIDYL